jgi:hypothetical protein
MLLPFLVVDGNSLAADERTGAAWRGVISRVDSQGSRGLWTGHENRVASGWGGFCDDIFVPEAECRTSEKAVISDTIEGMGSRIMKAWSA